MLVIIIMRMVINVGCGSAADCDARENEKVGGGEHEKKERKKETKRERQE
jgi:hypothetical protein